MEKRPKILQIITGIDVSGAENHLLSLVRGLDKSRYDIAVAYLKGNGELKGEFEKIGISPIYIGMRFNYDITALWKLYSLIRKNRYDIVHTHLFHADIYGVLAAFLAKTPVIVSSEHNEGRFLKKKLYSFLHRWTSLRCHKLIAISEQVKKYMITTGIRDANKIEVVYYGLDWTRYDSLGDLSYIGKEFNIDQEENLIGTVARLTEQKGLNYLLEAFARVLETEPKCKLIIVGRGGLEKQLKDLSRKLGIEDKVIFTGFRKDIPEIMSSIDIFVLPSLWEGLGLVLLEAMAAKKPIVATNVSAIPEIVLDGKTGILVPPSNAEALADGILRLVKQRNLAKTMGETGRERLEVHFGIEKMVKRVERIYDELIKNQLQVKVLHIITRFLKGGGTEKNITYSMQALDRAKFSVDIAIGGESDLSYARNTLPGTNKVIMVKELNNDFNPIRNLKALYSLFKLIRRNRYTIVHTHQCKASILGSFAAKIAKTPVIIFGLHGDYLENPRFTGLWIKIYGLIEQIVVRYATMITSVGEELKEKYVKRYGFSSSRCEVVRSGVELSNFHKAANFSEHRINQKRQNLNIGQEEIVIGKVARMEFNKGYKFAIQAAEKIIRGNNKDIKFLFIGDGNQRAELQDMVKRLGLGKKIIFTGFRGDVDELMSIVDIFLFTSLWEGLPQVLVQAAAAGKPIVSFETRGTKEIVKEGINGFVLPCGDMDGLVEKVNYLVSNLGKAKEMGRNGKRIIGNKWDIAVMQEGIRTIYDKLVNKKYKDYSRI